MTQEEKKPHFSDYLFRFFELYEAGKVTGIKINVDASLNNEEVTKLQTENDHLKAKLDRAYKALDQLYKRHLWHPSMGNCICNAHLEALDVLKEIEGE